MTEQGNGATPPNELNYGSLWHRWEPHAHAPGTVLNDQFSGGDAWEKYLTALEVADPPIKALAVTDYYLLDSYEKVLEAKRNGRLQNCDLIFPNVEMRLDIATAKGRWVNVHLLCSPEDPNHIKELRRFIERLSFTAYDDKFNCSADDLEKLGRAANPNKTTRESAISHGAEQFKVNLDQLKDAHRASEWAEKNILFAVSGSKTDGSSGVREGADATLRREIEKFAHIIFASSEEQREFWTGLRAASIEQLAEHFGGPKPCLHGSDCHSQDKVAAPDGNRYSWVKGRPTFDALRQACIDPQSRAHVGVEPPLHATASQVISRVDFEDAPWMQTKAIGLNSGLVAIIGARGSGKTALADMIAAGASGLRAERGQSSFLKRAGSLVGDAKVKLHWQNGDVSRTDLGSATPDGDGYPRVRYLSQQFVDELCSAEGLTDELLLEIERVIFEAHSPDDQAGASDFRDLLDSKASRFRNARQRDAQALSSLSESIGDELEKRKLVDTLQAQVNQKTEQIKGYEADRAKLVTKGGEDRAKRLAELSTAAEAVRALVKRYDDQEQAVLTLKDEVDSFRSTRAPETLRQAKALHRATNFSDNDWSEFLLEYSGEVDQRLESGLKAAQTQRNEKRGSPPKLEGDKERPLIPDGAKLTELPLAVLDAEIERLQGLISVDKTIASRFKALSTKIVEEKSRLTALQSRLEDCKGAETRVAALLADREIAYERLFGSIVSEEELLARLYAPLMGRLAEAQGTLGKLSFTVARTADVASWAAAGENLLDLRTGEFRGRGSLKARAEQELKAAWETGNAASIGAAMKAFRQKYTNDFLKNAPFSQSDQTRYRDWTKRFAKWLYGTDHIQLSYGIEFDGVDIRNLSPGTRGIVLLLLYLAMDENEDIPLIIDQPEENLDPKSIFDELVGLFTQSKTRRQVIMVTHNANLVINTDADQIIVAESRPQERGKLPPITYTVGGLEDADIRRRVCEILEGGEEAFKARARRLRVRLKR